MAIVEKIKTYCYKNRMSIELFKVSNKLLAIVGKTTEVSMLKKYFKFLRRMNLVK